MGQNWGLTGFGDDANATEARERGVRGRPKGSLSLEGTPVPASGRTEKVCLPVSGKDKDSLRPSPHWAKRKDARGIKMDVHRYPPPHPDIPIIYPLRTLYRAKSTNSVDDVGLMYYAVTDRHCNWVYITVRLPATSPVRLTPYGARSGSVHSGVCVFLI